MTRTANAAAAPPRGLTPADVAAEWQVDVEAVLGWIRSGELRARNVARKKTARRPRWRIDRADLDEFMRGREFRPAARVSPRRRAPAAGRWF